MTPEQMTELGRLHGLSKKGLLSMAQVDWLFELISETFGVLDRTGRALDTVVEVAHRKTTTPGTPCGAFEPAPKSIGGSAGLPCAHCGFGEVLHRKPQAPTAEQTAELRAKEWTFCPVHEIVVKRGVCHFCGGDRNLIQIVWTGRLPTASAHDSSWNQGYDESDEEG